jgi:inosine-uridine nucleoside N-ribohydrolase
MAPKTRVIIDTDPGIDDLVALLLALSTPASQLEVLAITLVRGNVDVHLSLRNVVTLFHTLEQELAFRRKHGLPENFDGVTKFKPLVAIGSDEPLLDPMESDFFHGRDGMLGVHGSHPHLSPQGEWADLFKEEAAGLTDEAVAAAARGASRGSISSHASSFVPSTKPAHEEILRLLRENEAGTITLISIGPLTNFAIAAAEDPETFLRAKEVVVMGGTVEHYGNVSPVAEFNIWADPLAAARVFALSGPNPASTIPKELDGRCGLKAYPEGVTAAKQLRMIMMGLDVTESHVLTRELWEEKSKPWVECGSPLAIWSTTFVKQMLDKMERMGEGAVLTLHDPMCVYYALTAAEPGWKFSAAGRNDDEGQGGWEDIRVECGAQWTRGMTVGDTRPRKRRGSDGFRTYDQGNWLGAKSGNRIWRVVASPGVEGPGRRIVEQLFG